MIDKSWIKKSLDFATMNTLKEVPNDEAYCMGVENFQERAIKVLSEQNWNNEDERLACIEILENLEAFD